jgi:hypothetical protein
MTTIHDDAKKLARLMGARISHHAKVIFECYWSDNQFFATFNSIDIARTLAAFDRHYKRGVRAGMRTKKQRRKK